MDVRVGLKTKLSTEELMLSNHVRWWRRLLRAPWTARRSNKSILKKIIPEYSLKDWHWSWSSSSLANWCEELTHLKRPWCWERLKARGEGNYGKTTRCLFEALRKQQEIQFKVTRVHGLISWGQWVLHEQWESERWGFRNIGSPQVRTLLANALWVLWCSCGDLCFQPPGALCTENNIEVPKKIINWGRDWDHGKLTLSKKPDTFCIARAQ